MNKLLLLGAAPSWRNVAGRTRSRGGVEPRQAVGGGGAARRGRARRRAHARRFQWLLQEQEARDVGEGGATPLMLAAARGLRRTLAMLLERGASTAAVDAGGRTAADVARSPRPEGRSRAPLAAASDAFGPEALFNAAVGGTRRRCASCSARARARAGARRRGDRAPRRLVEPRPPDGGDDAARRGGAHRRADVRPPRSTSRAAAGRHLAERRHGVRLRIGGGRRRAPRLARRSGGGVRRPRDVGRGVVVVGARARAGVRAHRPRRRHRRDLRRARRDSADARRRRRPLRHRRDAPRPRRLRHPHEWPRLDRRRPRASPRPL